MQLTTNELEQIAAKGSYLKERLEGKTLFIESNEKEKRFEVWKSKAGGSGGEQAFLKRLRVEDISIEKAKEISNNVAWDSGQELPQWSEYINDMLFILPADETELKEKVLFDIDKYLSSLKERTNQKGKTFVEAEENMISLLPFIYYAEKKLIQRMGKKTELFSKEALSQMSEILILGLYNLVYKTISEKLRIFILRKESFGFLMNLKDEDCMRYMTLYKKELLDGGWKEIFLEYPVLPRIMTTVINNWIDNMELFSIHLKEDLKYLENELNDKKTLGKVETVKGSISDAHNKGKGVIIVGFEAGSRIVYKPRNLQIDIAYKSLVDSLMDMKFPYELIAPKALNFENHGWIEFIEYKALDSRNKAKDFYYRAGALLCLVYAMGGNDFHGENMIASGEQPVLIDLETIISYKMIQLNEEYENMKEAQDFVDIIQESVLGIGFLPVWLTTSNDICIDFGALTGNIATSMPSFEGQTLKALEYRSELLEGFGKAYDFFITNKDLVYDNIIKAFFSESPLRIILRPTNVYAKMLYHTVSPEILKDGFLYSVEMERFAPAYLIKVDDQKVKKLWDMFLYERDSLEERDIPIFYGLANERNIKNSESILYEDYFMDSVIDRIKKKLLRLGRDDKERQLDFIKESLSIYEKNFRYEGERIEGNFKPTDMQSIEKEELLAEAQDIYEEIMKKAINVGDGNISWISYQSDIVHQKSNIGQTIASLYDGIIGISLFVSALYSLKGVQETKQNALLLIEPFRKALRNDEYKMPVHRMSSGLGNGLGGILKALIMIGDSTDEKALYEDALYLVEKITKEQIIKDKRINVLTGLAGLMQGLIICYERFNHEYSLELAKLCGQQILKNKKSVSETDFEYGSSGIMHSLEKLYRITGDVDNMELSQVLKDTNSIDIEMIIKKTLEYPLVFGDQLYCGNSGRLDFLMTTAMRFDKPELLMEVNKYIHWMIDRKNTKGYYNIEGVHSTAISNPSLFQGLSGIGYEILRCVDPKKIESILY
ncbi:MAG: DUF4135 domain-containing protein [Peptostreptococcaceae bacterium]|nr:DUF4135 domain-containing protein [Peptostreptococcaceae bacterium]